MLERTRALSRLRHKPDVRGWYAVKRARVGAYHFYATRLRSRELAFDIGANHGQHTAWMLNRGARVLAVEPQRRLAAELTKRFPSATVLSIAVSDEPGRAVLHHFLGNDEWASLDARWGDFGGGVALVAAGSEDVGVTTLDELINEYGEPSLVKIDTEGFDHLVLQGLSRPIKHILFEVHAVRPGDAAEALERLEELGRYEYRVSPKETWQYRKRKRPEDVLSHLPSWGSVYARRIR